MATTPQIELRDGSGYTQTLAFSTNEETVLIQGILGADTADVQVSVQGAPFVSDPNLVQIIGLTFVIPNLNVYPDGLPLAMGPNVIRIRAIDIVGGVSGTASVTATRVESFTQDFGITIPSGIKANRRRNAVDILVAKPDLQYDSFGQQVGLVKFIGFNIYASTSPSGATGYYKINETPIDLSSSVYEETSFLTVDDLALWSDPQLKNIRVRVTEEDEFGTELAEHLNSLHPAGGFYHQVRFTGSLEDYKVTEFVSFRHIRSGGTGIINTDQFINVPSADPLYYVATGVYFDTTLSIEVETPYSQEVLGSPLIIDTAIRDLPGRSQLQIVLDYVASIQRLDAELSLIPGSTTRDVSIDPFASEAERLWFLLDFVHRSQSFLTLLQIDDVNGDGISDPIPSSSYKTALKAALGLTDDAAVQALIDQQFDKLAGNENVTRLSGRPAIGQVVLYTATRPTQDIPVPANSYVSADADTEAGLSSVRFRIGGSFLMLAANADAYYNFSTKRYELTVDIVCERSGTSGNRSAGTIKNITGVAQLSAINTESTVFGTDRETNADLAARAMLAFVSVDTGTGYGYQARAAAQVSIIKAKVVKSGDDLMMRDWDDVRKKHIGGKVDIWVQGLRERQITENFAFTFEIARDIQCQIIDVATLTLRVLDSRVTANTPIDEILNNPVQGLGVRNATLGADYDLTGVQIIDYQTFKLSTAVAQPVTMVDDVIYADYRFRVVNQFVFTYQPVRRVVSCVGEVSGALNPSTHFSLVKLDDPLMDGESTIAKNYLAIQQVNGVPSGNSIVINDEVHVLIGFVKEPLDSIGINTKTIRVFNADRTVEYDGPGAAAPDFAIEEGTATTPARIIRTSASTIVSGQSVSVDYTHDENFTVTYVINDLLQELQQVIEKSRHITADALVKQAIENELDIETTVQLKVGSTKEKTDPAIRSEVSLELNRKTIGQGSAQSDIINAVDSTPGVDYEVVPLARFVYADGSRRLREEVLNASVRVPSLDIGGNRAYLLQNALQMPTTDGGGETTEHRGVFQDDEPMTLASSLLNLCTGNYQAFIIGSTGAIIAGYTDPTTLLAEGFLTTEAQAEELLVRTANHVALSIADIPADDPSLHDYRVSYVVRGDSGAHDFLGSAVEFLQLGAFTITYREAT